MNVRKALAKLCRTRGARTVRPSEQKRPTLELLEDRCVPTQNNHWVGPDGGAWSAGANWSLGRSPNDQDWIIFDGPNTGSVDDIPSLTVQNISTPSTFTGIIMIGAGNSLTSVNGLDHYGGLILAGGSTLTVNGAYFENGLLTGSGGAVIHAGEMIVNTGGAIDVPAAGAGVLDLSITTSLLQSGTITVEPLASLSISGSYNLQAGGRDTLFGGSILMYTGMTSMQVSGVINMIDGATISTSSGLSLGGTLNTINDLSTFSATPDVILGNLDNSGTINWVGALHGFDVTGNYGQFVGTLSMRIELLSANDTFMVGGTASLHGTLNVSGDVSSASSAWGLINVGGFTGAFEHVNLPAPAPGPGWTFGWVLGFDGRWTFVIAD